MGNCDKEQIWIKVLLMKLQKSEQWGIKEHSQKFTDSNLLQKLRFGFEPFLILTIFLWFNLSIYRLNDAIFLRLGKTLKRLRSLQALELDFGM